MAKRSKSKKSVSSGSGPKVSSATSGSNSQSSSPMDIAFLVLAAAGILVTAYLTYSAWFEVHPAFCGEDSGCDLVQASRWSTFLGIPMAFWGLLTYAVIARLAWGGGSKPSRARPLVFVTVCGFAISAYLTIVSIIEIEATCPYCLASFGIITTLMVLTLVRQPPNWLSSLKEAAVIAVLIVSVLHMHYSGLFDAAAGPEDPQLRALAVHLTDTGAKFYGAYWCPRCQEQKAVFAASAKRLPYVECSAGGRGSPLTKACAAKNIKNYPTWIIGDRRMTGLQKPRSLAISSGFNWQE